MKYFVTGTGTDVGKTYITALLAKQNGWRALKPVSSGSNDEDILGCQPLYKFKTPVSPHHAARFENVDMDFAAIVDYCKNSGADIIEGAGGVLSPLTQTHTNLDLIRALNIPVILVAGNYVGTITHTLTALKMLEGFDVSVVLNECEDSINDINAIVQDIKNFGGMTPLVLKHFQEDLEIK